MTPHQDQDYGTATATAEDQEDAATGTAAGDDLGDDEDDADVVDVEDDADVEDVEDVEDDADVEDDDVLVVAAVTDASEQPGTASQYPADVAGDSVASPSGYRAEPLAVEDPVASTDPDLAVGRDLDSVNLSQQWHDIQARFVDDPADAVRLAAQAAEAAITELVSALHSRQSALTPGTADAARPDTEQLRSILRECRTLCQDVAEMGRRLTQTAAS
jgi:hypothetical protein